MRTLLELPSPPGLPLLGNALQLKPDQLHLILEQWAERLGSLFTIRLGPQRVLVSTDHQLLQTALRERPESFRRFSPIEAVIGEMGWNGVFSTEGAGWLPQRRLVMQALAATHFRGFFPLLRDITDRLRRRWLSLADQQQVVDMARELERYTVDVTTALAFGEDPNTIETDGDAIQDHLARVFPMVNARINAPFPYWRYVRLPRDRELDRALAAIARHIHGLIERTRRRMHNEPSATPRNLLEAMLTAAAQPQSGVDDALVAANVKTLLLAGEDTTAHTLAWAMFFIGKDPKLQTQLQLSADEALAGASVCQSFESLKDLDPFEATALEASRLKPIVPMFFLEALADTPLGDVQVPAGTPLFFLLRPAMLDDRHFAQAGQIRPERWLRGTDATTPHDARAYAQFGAGPRVCPGRHLAGVELKLALSMLARNFTLQLVDGAEPREVMSFTMKPDTLKVRLTRRH